MLYYFARKLLQLCGIESVVKHSLGLGGALPHLLDGAVFWWGGGGLLYSTDSCAVFKVPEGESFTEVPGDLTWPSRWLHSGLIKTKAGLTIANTPKPRQQLSITALLAHALFWSHWHKTSIVYRAWQSSELIIWLKVVVYLTYCVCCTLTVLCVCLRAFWPADNWRVVRVNEVQLCVTELIQRRGPLSPSWTSNSRPQSVSGPQQHSLMEK